MNQKLEGIFSLCYGCGVHAEYSKVPPPSDKAKASVYLFGSRNVVVAKGQNVSSV